jgi:hypothetical protein
MHGQNHIKLRSEFTILFIRQAHTTNKINLQAYETVLSTSQSVRPLTRLFSESVKFPLNFVLNRHESCIDTLVRGGQ